MSQIKRVLVSLAAGLLLIPLMLGLLLAVKIFWPTDVPTAFLWLFLWPLPLLRLLSRITNLKVTPGNVLVVGLLGEYLFLSFLAYFFLTVRARLLKRKTRLQSLPPPPVPFTHQSNIGSQESNQSSFQSRSPLDSLPADRQ